MEPLVRQLYGQAEGGRRRPTLAELSGVFQSACKAFVKVFVVTDALDESEHRVRRQFISSLVLTASPNVALLLMSRPHIQILGYLSEMFTEIEIQAQDSDLRLFLDSRIADSEDLEWVLGSRESGMKMINDQIIKNAASRWVKFPHPWLGTHKQQLSCRRNAIEFCPVRTDPSRTLRSIAKWAEQSVGAV